MDDLEKNGNLIEAGLWFVISLVLTIRCWRSTGGLRRVFAVLAVSFFFFGISDIIESRTGAWWRPIWLLLLKGACVLVFIFGFRAYYRMKRRDRGTDPNRGDIP